MKKLSLTVTIYIVLSLLFVIGNFTAVLASPGRIEDAGFEAVTNWTYSETDLDYTDGAQSSTWATQGPNSYKLSAAAAGLGKKYTQIAQSNVNFSLLDRFSFDCQLYSDTPNQFEAEVWADGNKVWSQTVPTSPTNYLQQSVDVSGITNPAGELIIRVDNPNSTGNFTLTTYFDNIKIWGSHSDATFLIVENSFAGATNYAYMYGENFDAGTTQVGWYDAGGTRRQNDDNIGWGGGILDWAACYFMDYPVATPGSWHAVVLLQADGAPATYAEAIADPQFVADDVFNVDATAIPEFPEVMAAIGVAGLCFGIYWWMRKRARRVCGVEP